MTQAELAEACGVSFQAVQKWESDAYAPTLEKLALLSKRFSVSLDELVLDRSDRLLEEQKRVRLLPEYACVPDDESYPEQLRVEYTQSVQEGRDIAAYQELFEQVRRMPRGEFKERMADVLFDLTTNAGQVPDYPFAEPSDYEGIRAQWAEDRPADQPVAAETMRERIAGAWYGRICGCLLGKTVECIRTPELTALLKATGNYPMRRYILRAELTDEILQATGYPLATRCYADAIPCAPADDDTNYTVLYQELIRKYGRDFTPYDVSRMWLDSQPKNAYCTAERVAFINFVKGFNAARLGRAQEPLSRVDRRADPRRTTSATSIPADPRGRRRNGLARRVRCHTSKTASTARCGRRRLLAAGRVAPTMRRTVIARYGLGEVSSR